jgi:hypothetical protein
MAERTLSSEHSELQTSTLAPVASAAAPMKSWPPAAAGIDDQEVALEQLRRLPRLPHRLGVRDAVDAVEQLQAGR